MKVNHKIVIDMEIFLKTGKFDYLEIGNTQEWILNNFPEPDDWTKKLQPKGVCIWKYGEIELNFYDGKLTSIYSDCFCKFVLSFDDEDVIDKFYPLHGGESLDVIPWIFAEKLTVNQAMTQFMQEKMDFFVQHNTIPDEGYHAVLTLESGVSISFSGENINDSTLTAFSFKGKTKA